MTFYKDTVKKIEFEVSSFCNARCPLCVREMKGGDHSFFAQKNLDTIFLEICLGEEFAKNLEHIYIAGVTGDPAMNPHLPNVIRWFRNANPDVFIEISSNGGIQKETWWYELGELLGQNSKMTFAIDGMEDTNHIYRRNVKWAAVMRNAKFYIDSGAPATWQFIPFKHNQHQVEYAEALSKEMGFKEFKTKITYRNVMTPQTEIEYADDPRYTHDFPILDFTNKAKIEKHFDELDISCAAINDSSCYISAEGLVYPCCHLASLMLLPDDFLPDEYDWIPKAKESFSRDDISLYKADIFSIFASKTYMMLKENWNKTIQAGRNPMCSLICGKSKTGSSISQKFYS
jgi:MoaA/NifB/PqqE/SkfB family radical SAM enzyme